MAITAITPASLNPIEAGDSFSFTVDDTYTSMVIEVETSGGWEYAYDSSLGGQQTGYTVIVVDNGSTHTFTVSRDAGFDNPDTNIKVTEDETGSSATTSFSYTLATQDTFPDGVAPYYGTFTGNLRVTEDNAVVRSDVGWIDFDDATFDVADSGSGKVTVTGLGGGGGGTLDAAINFATPDNDVVVPLANRIFFRDGGTVATTPLTVVKSGVSVNIPALHVQSGGACLEISGLGSIGWKHTETTIEPSDSATSGITYEIGAASGAGATTSTIAITGNATTLAGGSGGQVNLRGGAATTGAAGSILLDGGNSASGADGDVRIGDVFANEIIFGKGVSVREASDHPVAPAEGRAQLWVRDDAPNTPMFTNDDGDDFDLTPRWSLNFAGRFFSSTLGTWEVQPPYTCWTESNYDTDGGTGANPDVATLAIFSTYLAPSDLRLTDMTLHWNTADITSTGVIGLYKVAVTDDSDLKTVTQLGSTFSVAGATNTLRVNIEEQAGLTDTISKGDKFIIGYKSATVAAAIRFSFFANFERTS